MNRTYILSRRQAYQHTQDVRFSSIGSGAGRTFAKEDAYGGLRWRLEDAKACTLSAHRWAVGSSRGGGHGQGSPACDCPPARGRTWAAGAWLLRAVASAAVAALSAPRRRGTGLRLLRGWGWGKGGGVGVGPLILEPFLLEHSFWGILGSSSVVTAGRRAFVSSGVGVGAREGVWGSDT